MGQDTRRDPRAKVLSMTVRYKSATLDEFIEHHSYDISRGGMFVKTPSPFPPGTLLKFEVKIAEERRVMQGVGRVVWKRESSVGGVPAGMGVKFIKIDDDSKSVIDRLVTTRGEGTPSAFERGDVDRQGSSRPSARPSSRPEAQAAAPKRPSEFKATVIGLGNLTPERDEPEEDGATFFPKDDSSVEAPPEDERTVMRQATEFLSDALVSAGGSLEEVSGKPTTAPKQAAPKPPRVEPPPPRSNPEASAREAPARKKSTPPVPPSAKRSSLEPPAPPAHARKSQPADEASGDALAPARFSENPRESGRKSSASVAQVPSTVRSERAGQKAMILLLGVALVAGVAVWFIGGRTPDTAAPKAPTPARATPHPEAEEKQLDEEAEGTGAPGEATDLPKPTADAGAGPATKADVDAGAAPTLGTPPSVPSEGVKPPSSVSAQRPEVVTPPVSKRPVRPPRPPKPSTQDPADTTTPVPPSTGALPPLPPPTPPPADGSTAPAKPSAEPPPPKTGPAADNPYG